MRRVGLYFGSFNPVHMGHLMLAQYMVNFAGVDEVRLVVSPQNPFKQQSDLAKAEDRLAMARLATEGMQGISVSDIELTLPLPSYTIDTLDALRKEEPASRFVIIMGADNVAGLNKWKDAERLLSENEIIVYPREGWEIEAPENARMSVVEAPRVEIASTTLRKWIAEGKSVDAFVPRAVCDYIAKNNLYR